LADFYRKLGMTQNPGKVITWSDQRFYFDELLVVQHDVWNYIIIVLYSSEFDSLWMKQ
jgi:hypothetical protein